jgi:hypothetical protein
MKDALDQEINIRREDADQYKDRIYELESHKLQSPGKADAI